MSSSDKGTDFVVISFLHGQKLWLGGEWWYHYGGWWPMRLY